MKTLILDVADDFFDKFTHVLDALPAGKVTIHKDNIRTEISKRISAIDNDSEELTPYDEGLERLHKKYANR